VKQEAIRYSGGIVKIPVSQGSMMDGEIPRIAVKIKKKVDELYAANKRIEELENVLRETIQDSTS